MYWHRRFGLHIGTSAQGLALTGSWKEGMVQTYTPLPNNQSVTGSWEVKTKDEFSDVSSTGDPCPNDAEEDEMEEGVFVNDTSFDVYETLTVTGKRKDCAELS